MKKMKKGLLVLSTGFLLFAAGCSCNNGDNGETPPTINYDEDKNYESYSSSLQGLYEESVKSTVAVLAYASGSDSPSLGTGVVYKQEGNYAYIATNAHVLISKSSGGVVTDYTNRIEVVYSNYVRGRADFMAYDRNEDVAVLRIPVSSNYEVATIIEDDSATDVGEAVYAIGNPHGQYFSMSEGIISASKIKTSVSYISQNNDATTFVYNSTATINAGNSGGPLFNAEGKVVAINSMYPNDANAAIPHRNFNYSIPAKHFINVADFISKNGNNSYKRVSLSLSGWAIHEKPVATVQSASITIKNGIYVTSSSYANVPANSSVITAIGGVEIRTMADLEYELFTKYANSSSVQLTIKDRSGANPRVETVSLIRN